MSSCLGRMFPKSLLFLACLEAVASTSVVVDPSGDIGALAAVSDDSDVTGFVQKFDAIRLSPGVHYHSKALVPTAQYSNIDGSSSVLVSNAYYINLNRSVDRKQHMEKELLHLTAANGEHDLNFTFERFPAVDKRSPQIKSIMESLSQGVEAAKFQRMPNETRSNWPGTVANYISHLSAWRHAWEHATKHTEHAEFVLMMEDDVEFHVDAMKHLHESFANVPRDADIIVLGTFGSMRPSDLVAPGVFRGSGPFVARKDNQEDLEAQIKATDHPHIFYGGMHAYLIRVSRLPQLMDYYQQGGYTTPEIATAWDSQHMRKYVLSPALASQNGAVYKSLRQGA